jgi:hypothetical protein
MLFENAKAMFFLVSFLYSLQLYGEENHVLFADLSVKKKWSLGSYEIMQERFVRGESLTLRSKKGSYHFTLPSLSPHTYLDRVDYFFSNNKLDMMLFFWNNKRLRSLPEQISLEQRAVVVTCIKEMTRCRHQILPVHKSQQMRRIEFDFERTIDLNFDEKMETLKMSLNKSYQQYFKLNKDDLTWLLIGD